MRIAVPKEIVPDERRVALVPDAVARLVQSGMEVLVESGAGHGALFPDPAYMDAGATIASDAAAVYSNADAVLKVQNPVTNDGLGRHEAALMKKGALLIAFLKPSTNVDLMMQLAGNGITSFSMDAVPRTARAQSMDALTSMASIAGYKAALIAAGALTRFVPMMITAAGTLAPAKGLVIGAGVAGLQAIATARRMGAVMYGYDVRPAVGEQVRSLGASFIESQVVVAEAEHAGGYARVLSAQTQQSEREIVHQSVAEVDFVISTAAVPGKPAPKIITEEMVRDMQPGSVIVDVAADTGGNCELTKPGKVVVEHDVVIHGPLDLPGSMPVDASRMYSRNISNFLLHLVHDGRIDPDFEDDITRATCVTRDGQIVQAPIEGQGRTEPQRSPKTADAGEGRPS